MREQLKTLLLGILILILVGFSAAFYQALNKTIPQLRPQINAPTPINEAGTANKTEAAPAEIATSTLKYNQIGVDVGTTTLILDLATTSAMRKQGLSGRASLAQNAGMLFVFEEPGLYGFWMKEMNFPLDFIWLNSEGKVVAITPQVAASTYPQAFYPPEPVKYVMEINANWAQLHNLEVGDVLQPLDF